MYSAFFFIFSTLFSVEELPHTQWQMKISIGSSSRMSLSPILKMNVPWSVSLEYQIDFKIKITCNYCRFCRQISTVIDIEIEIVPNDEIFLATIQLKTNCVAWRVTNRSIVGFVLCFLINKKKNKISVLVQEIFVFPF